MDVHLINAPRPTETQGPGARERRAVFGVCLFLAALVWIVFGKTAGYSFVNYDDGEYVYENPHVKGGLSWRGVAWAFTQSWASNWHPLTWLTHMADWRLYGSSAGGHHLTNVVLHATAAVLLFLVLWQMTEALWPSAFVSAVFAIHPLRVESVAWVAERKDVLSGVFFMLTLGAYFRFTRRQSLARYLIVVFLFALGLMAKPSLVTLPFVLLLLDYWPLKRFEQAFSVRASRWPWQLVLEKLPLFVLSGASCVVTVLVQTRAIMPIAKLPITARLSNAAWAYIAYLLELIYPVDLAVLYPLRIPPWWLAALFVAVLALITAAAFFLRKTQPWLLVGWLWYIGVLVPMIGIMQVGAQAHADRYTYLSQIGILIALTWTVAGACAHPRHGKPALTCAAAIVLIALAGCARLQTGYWRDSISLWQHTLACTSRNAVAHNMMALALSEKGRTDEAMAQFQQAMQINPNDPGTLFHLGVQLSKKGRLDEGIAYLRRGLQLQPQDPGAETDLGLALAHEGHLTEALAHYRKALEIDPNFLDALNNLAWALATAPDPALRNGAEAVTNAEHCCKLTDYKTPAYLDTLSAADAEAGDFTKATRWAQSALSQADESLKGEIAQHLESYEQGKPWREPAH